MWFYNLHLISISIISSLSILSKAEMLKYFYIKQKFLINSSGTFYFIRSLYLA